jgi:hypothetical protein
MIRLTLQRAFGLSAIATCLLALPRDAAAQTPCTNPGGPDVIVGDITGPANYTAVGGLEAVSLGTYSCNVGNQNVAWIAGNNQHPVIGGELYRFKMVGGAGHFDQIGISWLKHGFFALSNNLCCTNCQGTDGSSLGVRCSDPYTASRNGSQSGLGPRHTVNAFTGVFTYPPNNPSGGNTGRIEVDIADLEVSNPAGTRYFGNTQYVTQDDAQTGHGNNNASYREMTVTGSGSAWNFGFSGTTQREIPAIMAWQACETGVTINNIQIPGEGLVMLGFKATDLGNGLTHYEYAIYNMNSDRSIRSFNVPIPAGVNVSNVGFHDVTYRGGDGMAGNYSPTDWTFTDNGTSVEWATSTFAQSNNANAIRWATMYTFRFDANAVPTSGTVSLGTYKVAGSLLTTADVPGGPGAPGANFCSADGALTTFCPCLNFGATNNGCENSQNPLGAHLASAGSVSPDTVVLTASGELPSALTIVLQGTSQDPNGLVYGDGLRCVTGTLKRLYTKNAIGGVVVAPSGGDPSITTRSSALGDPILPGSTRYYMTYYRDPDSVFCPAPMGSTFNSTNGQIINW